MFVVAVSICLLVFVALAGANLLISDINSDELSNMGIEKKSLKVIPIPPSPMRSIRVGHFLFKEDAPHLLARDCSLSRKTP